MKHSLYIGNGIERDTDRKIQRERESVCETDTHAQREKERDRETSFPRDYTVLAENTRKRRND